MSVQITIKPNEKLYLRNPQDTKLGKKIIEFSIILIDKIGFEQFTFKKLAKAIDSTEASIYRYFENKHMLLLYLVSWYWEWVSYLIDTNCLNIDDKRKRLKITIKTIVLASQRSTIIDYVNEKILHQIIISEGAKAYHTKMVDKENTEGLFLDYKQLCKKVADAIQAVNPDFPYPHSLASNLFEMANNQIYFAQHLPRLTDIHIEENNFIEVVKMMEYFTFRLIDTRNNE